VTESGVPDACPLCGAELARADQGPPWCPDCEWNLAAYDPRVLPARGWRWLERNGHYLAYRLDVSLFERLSEQQPTRRYLSVGRLVLVTLSALIFAAVAASWVFGGYLIVNHPSFGSVFLGVALILLALLFRPRFGRAPRSAGRLTPSSAPLLFALLDEVAVAVGTHRPDYVVLTLDDNASMSRCGLRGRSVLRLGGQLWVSLAPQLRVAMLAHEFGHMVNSDPNRGLLVQPVMTSFGRLARWTGAERTLGGDILAPGRRRPGPFSLFGELFLWAISRVFLVLHLAVTAIGARDHHRAEYLADAMCADVAGTAAAIGLMDRLLLGATVRRLIYHSAVHRPPSQWQASVDSYLDARADSLPLRRQHSARTTSLWDSHPASGRRGRILQIWPARPPRVVLTDVHAERIDAESSRWLAAVHSDVLGTRDFVARRSSAARGVPTAG
jgi:Zn-dependent protease with chaperone function